MIGLSVGSLLGLNGASNALIPTRTLGEMTRIAADPFRDNEFSLATGLLAEAGVRAAVSLAPPVLRLVSELRQARGRPLSETLLKWTSRARPPEAPRLNPDLDPVLSRHPKAFGSHPMVLQAAGHLRAGRFEEARGFLRQNWCRLPTFLTPVLKDLLGDLGSRSLLNEEGVQIIEDWKQFQAAASLKDQFPVGIFGKSNLRGVVDYDRDAFGKDRLTRLGVRLHPEETVLWKMIAQLPRGARVSDWASGAGIFGHEVKARRPDLQLTSVDLFSPEEILAAHLEPPWDAATLRSEMDFRTGNALEVGLADEERSDLLVSVFLLPWVPDPLRFFAHMYNQLKPGGVMLATVHMETYDVDRPFGERMIGQALREDLRAQGIQVDLVHHDRTIAVRRRDERRMSVKASLESSSFEEITHAFGLLSLYYNFYRRSPAGPAWISLE